MTPEPETIHFAPDRPYYSRDLMVARAQTHRRRAAAMVSDYDYISGVQLRAVTPATYSMLTAIGSPFTFGADASEEDVRNYFWLHSDRFTDDPRAAPRAQASVFELLQRNIAPPWRRWGRSRSSWRTLIVAGYAVAAGKIAELLEVAFADAPPPGTKGPKVGASLEAQFVDTFANSYRIWPFATPIQHTPLRKLYQLLRCMNGGDYDKDEAEIIAAELAEDNREAIARAQAQQS